MIKISIASLALVALLALPGMAMGQGNAALDQYAEGSPGPTGDVRDSPGSGSGGSDSAGSGSVAPSSAGSGSAGSGSSGSTGQAVSDNVAERGSGRGDDPPHAVTGRSEAAGRSQDQGSSGSNRDAGPGDPNRGGTGVVGQSVGGSEDGGIGLLLPLILGATLLGAVGIAVLRRRRAARSE